MNQKDLYAEFDEYSEQYGETPVEAGLSDMEMYLRSAQMMEEEIDLISSKEVPFSEKVEQINLLRRTGFLATSTYFQDIWEMSFARTKLFELMKNYRKLIRMNRNFFKQNDLKLVKEDGGYSVRSKSGVVFVEREDIAPDVLLQHIGITPDNQADYHFLAGYLLLPKNHHTVQLALIILETSEKIDNLFKRWV